MSKWWKDSPCTEHKKIDDKKFFFPAAEDPQSLLKENDENFIIAVLLGWGYFSY